MNPDCFDNQFPNPALSFCAAKIHFYNLSGKGTDSQGLQRRIYNEFSRDCKGNLNHFFTLKRKKKQLHFAKLFKDLY